jgi:hypothetical protein
MLPEDFASLNLARYELNLSACEACSLPAFLGSTIRGAFGHALKEAVCIMPHRNCESCMVADRCVYPFLFETAPPAGSQQLRGQHNAPHPFIFTPPLPALSIKRVWKLPASVTTARPVTLTGISPGQAVAAEREAMKAVVAQRTQPQSKIAVNSESYSRFEKGGELHFGLTLLGQAIDYLPYMIYAISEMAHKGLGSRRIPFELKEAYAIGEKGSKIKIYSGKTQQIATPVRVAKSLSELVKTRLEELENESSDSDVLKIRFVTPTRIRVAGDLLAEIGFQALVKNMLRRLSMLMEIYTGQKPDWDYRGLIESAAEVKTISSTLEWYDWERYSNRQKTKMTLGGFLGEVQYQGKAIKAFYPLLAACELFNIGSGTSFGLGKYEIKRAKEHH